MFANLSNSLIVSMYDLEIKNLYKTYSNGVEALKGINLSVKSGDFFALLGANGAGKSTTIGLITSLLTKTSGSIAINGYDLDQHSEQAKLSLGLVPQEINLNIFETCEQILLGQAGYYGVPRQAAKSYARYLLNQLGLDDKRHAQTRHLSGGMKRRLMIARALIHQPKVLILDEPTAGVDVEIRHHMWNFLTETNQQGTTIILTTHYLEEAERLCKSIAIIDKGQIMIHAPMQTLLKKFRHQTYIFTTSSPLPPSFDVLDSEVIHLNQTQFELRVSNHIAINQLFTQFNSLGIQVIHIQNKTNRLEELYLDLLKNESRGRELI